MWHKSFAKPYIYLVSQKSFVGQNFKSLLFCFSNFLRVYLIDVYVRNTLHPWYRARSPVLHPWYRAHTHVKLLKTYRPLKGILKTFENTVLRRNYVSKKFHTFLAMKTFRPTDKIHSVLKSGAPASAPPPTCITYIIEHIYSKYLELLLWDSLISHMWIYINEYVSCGLDSKCAGKRSVSAIPENFSYHF